jgi:four helix bundle protein
MYQTGTMIHSDSKFSFEDLEVWKKAVEYSTAVLLLTEKVSTNRKHERLIAQLEASVVSIASNIAEGKGRYSKREFIQYLYIARGSLYESVTQLIIFQRCGIIADEELNQMRSVSTEIAKMLSSLISSIRRST